ncbi:MAG TPA: VOC family protein [Chloroflexota bacterium]|nr:VOC family protein [Chloroflexota bacterium]
MTTSTSIHPDTEVGLLSLSVADLTRSIDFYTGVIGLRLLRRDESSAVLGAGEKPLLILVEQSGASEWPRGGRSHTGLYHFAILVPTRADLGRWARHYLEMGLPLGQGDHLVSEALYLEDPDGHGIEVYRDRPRAEWQWENGRVRMAADPVDIAGMIAEADREGKPFEGLPEGTKLGHMHLQVGDIAEAARFYHDILGFDIVAQMPSAIFISAGGYHHHIGMNTWHSLGAGPAPAGSVNLRFFTVDLPNEDARNAVIDRLTAANVPFQRIGDVVAVRDPWSNTILLHVGHAAGSERAGQLAEAYESSST